MIQKDYLLHIIICTITALIFSVTISPLVHSPVPAIITGFFTGVTLGIGKEYGDSVAIGNKWDWKDLLCDIIGSAIGSLGGFFNYII